MVDANSIETKDELLRVLLYNPRLGSGIRTGLVGDTTVSVYMTDELETEIREVLDDD